MATQSGTGIGIIGLGAVCATLLAACGGSGGSGLSTPVPTPAPAPVGLVPTPPAILELEQPSSCDAFAAYLADSLTDLLLQVGAVNCPSCAVATAGGAELVAAADTDAASFTAFTTTNGQEPSVDELDLIDADPNGNLFLLDGRHLVIADGVPPDGLHEIANLELTADGFVDGLMLDADNARLVAVVTRFGYFGPVLTSLVPPAEMSTELVFVDVADPTNPTIDARLSVDGFKLAVRRIGDRIHFVSHATPALPVPIFDDVLLTELRSRLAAAATSGDQPAQDTAERDIRARVAALVATTDPRDYLPDIVLHAADTDRDLGLPSCGDVALPVVTMPFALTSITSIDSDGGNAASLTVVNNSWNVYASEANLYLSQTSGGWWFDPSQRQQTAIYKIGIGSGAPEYRALGVVDGWAGSSFQFSEHAGYLRVATTRSEIDPASSVQLRDNNLYVLRDDESGLLDVVGSVLGFGENEAIFASRFLGDRGYIVTFRRIDPLFAFDLSVPENPRLAGELEIEGVSTYLHPLDATHLLTIGYAGDALGLNGRLKLQIYDVQDLADPRLLHEHVPSFPADALAWSAATFDHLAFNYFPAAGTLTVPAQYFTSHPDQDFSGFIAFAVDTTLGFTELGRLDHSALARELYCADPTGATPAVCDGGRYLEAATPLRALSALLDGTTYIYTLSNVALEVSAAQSFAEPTAVLPLPLTNDYIWTF